MSGFLFSYGLQRKERRERKEGGQNSEKLIKKNVLAPILSKIQHFEETYFFRVLSENRYFSKSHLEFV